MRTLACCRRAGRLALHGLTAVVLTAAALAQSTAPFILVDNVEGDYVDTQPVPIRPMALTADELHLYAVNTHASVVQHFDNPSGIPTQTFAVPRAPVAIALWEDPNDPANPGRLVVACRGTYALVILDRATGTVLHLLERRDKIGAEPGDLLVDLTTHTAFLSCSAPGVVIEVDLTGPSVVNSFAIPGKNPTFLCWDTPPASGLTNVLVAPLHSGNNSAARPDTGNPFNLFPFTAQAGGPTIVDFLLNPLGGPGLPDQDLFRIVRSSNSVQALTRGMGTIQFACGVNPQSGQVWQLNTEANNKDPNKQGEAAIAGDIVRNRVSIANLPAVGQPPVGPAQVIDLDNLNPALPFDPTRTVGQPYALAWVPGGYGMIAGLLTDNVTVLDSTGAFVLEWDVSTGAIPRGILYSPLLNIAFVYCWGTNKIEAYQIVMGIPLIFTLDLGYDPTPPLVRAGREVFYDAQHSEHNNASCASCHIDGRTDMLAWDLSDLPYDNKGPMVTQTMVGIEKMVTFHWRGEQLKNLQDFNGAFVKLLGATAPLNDVEFQAFEEFVFSLQNPANPVGNEDRLVDNNVQPPLFSFMPPANSVTGQSLFAPGSCERCHSFPGGTLNDLVSDGAGFGDQNPRRMFMKIAPFHEMYRKEQDADPTTLPVDLVPITMPALSGPGTETFQFPLIGVGLAHAGVVPNLNAFLGFFFAGFNQFGSDVTGFVHQWDQGMANAVHRAVLINQQTLTANPALAAVVQTYFNTHGTQQPGASHRNCDVVAFGTSTLNGVLTPMRWHFRNGRYWPEDTTFPSQGPGFFITQALAGQGSNVFLGLPSGAGVRFGVDFDGDQLFNVDELVQTTGVFNPDTDGDTFPDGHEVIVGDDPLTPQASSSDTTGPQITRAVTQFVTARVARINVETDEPSTVRITYTEGVTNRSRGSEVLARSHSILLNDLLPSTGGVVPLWWTYTGSIVARDAAGNASTALGLPNMPAYNQGLGGNPPLPITTRIFQDGAGTCVIGGLRWGPVAISIPPGGFAATPRVRVDQKTGGPPALPKPGHVVIARIFRNDVIDTTFTATGGARKVTGFDFNTPPVPFPGLTGPFLVSTTTDAQGFANLGFSLSGLSAGDRITLNIELVAIENTAPPTFTIGASFLWSMPDTPAENRRLDRTY